MTSRFLIYGLFDPRDGALRYVGKSTSGLRRARWHALPSALAVTGHTHKANWIRQLQALGLQYEVEVLEEHECPEDLDAAERFYIAYFRFLGCDLTNGTEGGDGTLGRKLSPEGKRAISKARVGKAFSDEHRRHLSEAARRRWENINERQKAAETSRRQFTDPQQRLKTSRAKGGRPIRDERGTVYDSISAASRVLSVAQGDIYRVLKDERDHAGGHIFWYADDEPRAA